MSHKGIRTLIEATVRSVQDDIKFSYGREEDFDLREKKAFTYYNLAPLFATASYAVLDTFNYTKTWQIRSAFYKYDKQENIDPGEILDITDHLCDATIQRLNKQNTLQIQAVSIQPFIRGVDLTTGHLLLFNIIAFDDYLYCEDCP